MSKETMTSRERVNTALNHQEPDRVPIDLGGFQTGIHKKAYTELIEYLEIKEEIEILDPVQQIVKPSEAILQKFHVDVRYITSHGPDSFKGDIEKNERDGRLWHDLKDELAWFGPCPMIRTFTWIFRTIRLQMQVLRILPAIHFLMALTNPDSQVSVNLL